MNDDIITKIQTKLNDLLKRKHKEINIIAIDGRGASGKSTLARNLERTLDNAKVVEFDDFYYPIAYRTKAAKGKDFYFDWQRLEKEVLSPLSERKETTYERYNWTENDNDGLVEGYSLNPKGIVIIEGCYTLRPELRKYYNATIWVESDKATCKARGLKRSIELKHHFWDQPKLLDQRWNNFQELEDIYISRYNPKDIANIVYNTVEQSLSLKI